MNKNKYLHVIVPHRGVNAGKLRLATVLTNAGRARLNRWLLDRTLAAVGAWLGDTARCVVVSPCEVTLALARKAGATALPEQPAMVTTADLNAALAQAAAHTVTLGAQRLLILPCDLPRLDATALQALEAVPVADADVVIAPDRLKPALVAALVYSFVRAITTVSAVIFLVTAENELATTYIIGRVGNGDYGVALAYCTVLIILMSIATALIQYVVGERKLGRRKTAALAH